jgi:TolB-like protein
MTSNADTGIPVSHLFGRWRFDANTGDLFDGETTTRLEPQVSRLLEYFLANQNKVISRDELIAAAWGNRKVSDDAINRCVSILRQILSPQDIQAYIETVVRKGYIAHFPPAPLPESPAARFPRKRQYFLLVILTGVVALFLYTVAGKFAGTHEEVLGPRGAGPPMVAVLPFTSESRGDGDNEFFANGIHNDLLTQLAKLQSIRVISGTSVKEYRNTEHNIRRIGKELGADAILEGSVQIAAERIRINAQLIDARTDEHLWAESYDRELLPANIFDVQSEIAQAIAQELNTTLTAQDTLQLALIPTENMAAYRAYHRAMDMRDADNAALSSPEYAQALEEAVELDPKFARAWAQLVNALAFQNFRRDDPDLTRRTEQALQNLQAVAPGSADYLMGLAAYIYYTLQDYDRAHDIISQALTIIPGDMQALEMRTWIERRQGDSEASLLSKKELQKLDPRNPKWEEFLVHGLFIMHRYDEAWAEITAYPLSSFHLDETANVLLFRDDRDDQRLQESMEELCQRHSQPDCGWEAYIANRNYPAALGSLTPTGEGFDVVGLSYTEWRQVMTYWLMNDVKSLSEDLSRWERKLEKQRDDSGNASWSPSNLGLALLAGAQGNVEESGQLIKLWLGPEQFDWADRNEFRHEACRVLGMIAATQAAVKCIRDGLIEPSHVTPFLEPYLPFYDSIRDQPEFREMLAEIDGEGSQA